MFQNDALNTHLATSFAISSQTAAIAEWNMSIPGNIFKIGNYRYRKNSAEFSALPSFFDRLDVGNFYSYADQSDKIIANGYETDEITPLLFAYPSQKEKLYYSLEDCIKPFRPRSGINKASFFNNKYFSHPNKDMFLRPRYYMPHRDDEFKYWRSYRTESMFLKNGETSTNSQETSLNVNLSNSNVEYGVSKNSDGGVYYIDDACPFVVYSEEVPANRLVIKVQTNVGNIDLGPFKNSSSSSLDDPFYGESNKTVPQRFKVQYLDNTDQWNDAYTFTESSLREDGVTPIFDTDGYLSLEYGLLVPTIYKNNFMLVGTVASTSMLPTENIKGHAYIVATTEKSKGTLYVYNGNDYDSYIPEYTWKIGSDGVYENTQFVSDLTSPSYYNETSSNANFYREFVWIKGIRLAVESMSVPNTPLELIEMSARLSVDLSPKTISYDINKVLSDLSSSALPVGQLIASTGRIELFDEDQAFNANNVWDGTTGSIVAKYAQKNIKFTFYEVIKNVQNANYYVPIKSLYTEGFPQSDQRVGTISIELRDFYFYFESIKAPRILLTEVSLSQAVCILLDSIGYSNYVFKRLASEIDPVIPYFFIAPDQNVAEVLNQLAVATQSAMFFDEYNNFVVMSKEYLLDDTGEREIDLTLYGSNNPVKVGIKENTYDTNLTNIIAISSQSKKVYNAGTINYTTRYIQRSYGSLQQSNYVDKSWIYKPSLLWEISGTEATKSLNAEKTQKYTLGALPLNTDLTDEVPKVVNRQIVNNTIDVGENAYWITRYKGFLYSGGEIIKYDAVEHNITGIGNVWISDNLEYQNYFANLAFNGKIYPTGNLRIYSEPYYETIDGYLKLKNGPVVEHGRGQFGTSVVYHNAGLDSYWSNNDNVQGCDMSSEFLFKTTAEYTIQETTSGVAGVNKAKASKSQRNGIIKNFMSSGYSTETDVGFLKSTQTSTIQSSALVLNGPDFVATETPRDFITYVYKNLDGAYKHFGTRLRLIGKVETLGDRTQSPVGGMTYFNVPGTDATQTVSIGGGSAGIALVNPLTNVGYYFEIAALTSGNLSSYFDTNDNGESSVIIDNVMFYKIERNSLAGSDSYKAFPTKLWGGNANILVDDGNFTGQYRFIGEDNPTVYDLSMEYVDVNETTRVFYLYINQKLVKVFTDTKPLVIANPSIGLFIRGTSKAMFEHVYALSKNYTSNSVFDLNTPIASIFGDDNGQINATEALNKYALSGTIQKTYLKGISSGNVPEYNLYFEEFGSIMRECAYFNIKYDRAYPALYAQIAPTFNRLRGYTVSGFVADSYGAEFLIFNNTDSFLNLDDTTGNYLRIQGIAFTQDTTNSITVDDYLKKRGNLSDPELKGDAVIQSPYKILQDYDKVKISRLQYGKNEFTLETPYIQEQSAAESLIGWIINKNLRPRRAVGVSIFPNPILQLGDFVNIDYTDVDGTPIVAPDTTKFVVYNIEYSKSVDGPSMTVYLSEV